MLSTSFVVLHAGEAVTIGVYLFRVVAYLLAFGALGVATFWGLRAVEIVHRGVRQG